LPSMEAAFVDVGKGRNAVLYAGEVNFDVSGLEGQPKRIESALKAGQSIIVQVTKDPVGHKGARLTSQVSLPGRYLVYVPGASMTGISRKLPDTERNRLKAILKKVMPENAGVIVRTAVESAAEEVVRQLRLRDVGGIVVIDFIDMVLESNRELVLRRLLECLSRDRTKHQVAEVTSLGLVQMTRKRVGAGLLEAFSTPCECCNGRGVILTFDPDSDGPAPAHHTHSRGHG